jgi:hypothetical protein
MSRVIVALAIERLVAIKFPLWSKYICTVVNARRIICCILVFTMIFQLYHFHTKGLDSSLSENLTKTHRCKTLPNRGEFDLVFSVYIWRLVLMTLLPLTIIITVNILITSKLLNESSLVDHTNVSYNARQKMKLVYKISRMLVIVTSVYLLLHLPGSSFDVIKSRYNEIWICNSKLQYYIQITDDILDLLTNFNYGINFYLYIISGKHIRNELIRLLKFSSFRSKSSIHNGKHARSSYFMSSYLHLTKTQPICQLTGSVSRRPTTSTIQRLSSC